MPEVVFTVDQSRSMRDQAVPGHNRWHPDIPPAVTVRPGQDFRVECRERTDGQIGNNDSANDVRDVDLPHAHMLSGPIAVGGPSRVTSWSSTSSTSARCRRSRAPLRGGLGVLRDLRQGQRRGLPHRLLPRRLQGHLGLPRAEVHLPPRPGGPVHRHHPPRPVRHRPVGGPAGALERPRAGADRHRPRPGPAAGAAAAARQRPGRHGHR